MAVISAITAHDVGDRVRLGNSTENTGADAFTNLAGVATNPTEVTLRRQPFPSGTAVVYRWPTPAVGESALTNESAGRFYAEWTPAAADAGIYAVELAGTGAVEHMDQWLLFVRESLVTV